MSYLETILNDEPVWTAMLAYTMGRTRRSTGKFQLILNCPMCTSRGETPDRTFRCGIIHAVDHVGVHCFNCRFVARFTVGERLSQPMSDFLTALGMPSREVRELKLLLYGIADLAETAVRTQGVFVLPQFAQTDLPSGARSLVDWAKADCQDPNYLAVVDYLLGRGPDVARATIYYWTPDGDKALNRRLIIPCWHDERLVGWIGRSIDPIKQKYYKQLPSDFLFNSKFLTHPNRRYIFIVEGNFDALVIDGVAALGGRLNEKQIRWINQCDKIPVVIPDRDKAGLHLVSIAIEQNWGVAIPNYGPHQWWHAHIKDVDEAVQHHGKLFTLRSIISSIVTHPKIINQRAEHYLLK